MFQVPPLEVRFTHTWYEEEYEEEPKEPLSGMFGALLATYYVGRARIDEQLIIRDYGFEKDFDIIMTWHYKLGERVKRREVVLKPIEYDTAKANKIIYECNKKEDILNPDYSIVYDDVPSAFGRMDIPIYTEIKLMDRQSYGGKLLVQWYRAVRLYIHESEGGILVAKKHMQRRCIDDFNNCVMMNFYPYDDEYVVHVYKLEDWQLRLLKHIYFEYNDLLTKAFNSTFRDFQKYWVYTNRKVSKALIIGAVDIDRDKEYRWGPSCDNEVVVGNAIICPVLQ